MDSDTEAPKDPGVQDNQRYTEQDYEGSTKDTVRENESSSDFSKMNKCVCIFLLFCVRL